MRRFAAALVVSALVCSRASAQQPPPRIGPFVVDLRVNFPGFPTDSSQLAASRGIAVTDLPGRGTGIDVGAHVYLFKWRAMTIGVGGEVIVASSQSEPLLPATGTTTPPPPSPPTPPPTTPRPPPFVGLGVSEQFTSFAPQVSVNFGSGAGWSYLSGGLGLSVWSTVPGTEQATPADEAHLKTINYGGGGRWFAKKHVAFTFDVRFWAINPGIPNDGFGLSPRETLVVIGAGVSVR